MATGEDVVFGLTFAVCFIAAIVGLGYCASIEADCILNAETEEHIESCSRLG
jgi:hypothetical protein